MAKISHHSISKTYPKPESKRMQREYAWAFSHYSELARRYPDQWVAFARKKVLASGSDPQDVFRKARQKLRWPEIPHLFVEGRVHFYLADPA